MPIYRLTPIDLSAPVWAASNYAGLREDHPQKCGSCPPTLWQAQQP
jgi:hypothetical protein